MGRRRKNRSKPRIDPTTRRAPAQPVGKTLDPAVAIGALVAAVAFGAFWPALSQGFIFDDQANIIDNENFRGLGWEQLKWMFTTFHMGHYQPLSWISLGLDYCLWGMNPLGYHLSNLVLHAISSLLVFRLARVLLDLAPSRPQAAARQAPSLTVGARLGDDAQAPSVQPSLFAAALAALLFAVHPLRVESVTWITERRDVLSSCLLLASLLCYVQARRPDRAGPPRRLISLALVFFVLSLLSRAMGVTLPAVLLVLDWYPLRRLRGGPRQWFAPAQRPVLMEKLLFLAPALVIAVVAPIAQHVAGATTDIGYHGPLARLAVASYGLFFYLYKTAWPLNLSPIYELLLPVDVLRPRYIFSVLFVIASTGTLIAVRRRQPAVITAALCYAITLLPILGFFQSGRQEVADRYSYLACIPWAILLAACAERLARRLPEPRGVAAGGALAVLCLATLAWKQCRVWDDSTGLWEHAVKAGPPSSMARYNLGCEYAKAHRTAEAIEAFKQALEVNWNYPDAQFNKANALQESGLYESALREYNALTTLPAFTTGNAAHEKLELQLANVHAALQRVEEASAHYRKAIEVRPGHSGTRHKFGQFLLDIGRVDDGIAALREAVGLDPANVEALYDLGRALALKGSEDEAMEAYARAIALHAEFPEALVNLGILLENKGRHAEALERYGQALAVEPDFVNAHFNAGVALGKLGKLAEAERAYRSAMRLAPEMIEAPVNLAQVLGRVGRREEAASLLKDVLRRDPSNAAAQQALAALSAATQAAEP